MEVVQDVGGGGWYGGGDVPATKKNKIHTKNTSGIAYILVTVVEFLKHVHSVQVIT